MKKFHEKVKKEFNESLNTIYKSSPYYNFPFNEIQRKIKEIQSFIYHYDPVHISLWSQQKNIPLKTEIKLGNKHIIPIIVNKIIFKSPEGLVYVKNTNLELKPRDLKIFTDKNFSKAPVNYKIIKLDSPNFAQYETLAIEYNILGSKKKLYKEILRPIENSIRDEIDIDNFLIKDDNFTVLAFASDKWSQEWTSMAFTKDDDDLRGAFDDAIRSMKADGALAKLQEKWFGKSFVDTLPDKSPTW